MVNHFIAGHPCQQNLHINFQLRRQSFEEFFASGYGDERGYDLVLESNALNDHENVSEDAHLNVAREMLYALQAGGRAVFIEPRGRVNCTRLQKFFDDMMVEGVAMLLAPRNCRVYCTGIPCCSRWWSWASAAVMARTWSMASAAWCWKRKSMVYREAVR